MFYFVVCDKFTVEKSLKSVVCVCVCVCVFVLLDCLMTHMLDGKQRNLLVHRKGSTRAFPPHHPLIPVDYQLIGQPVLIGGTMGTCRYAEGIL